MKAPSTVLAHSRPFQSSQALVFPLGISATDDSDKCCVFVLMPSLTEALNIRDKSNRVVMMAILITLPPLSSGPPHSLSPPRGLGP